MREIGNTICFATSYNSPKKNDGDEFVREMHNFSNWTKRGLVENFSSDENSKTLCHRLTKPNPRMQFFERLESNNPEAQINTLVFFMHGTWRELIGIETNIWQTQTLARVFKNVMIEPMNIVLYACGCGGGKGKWNNIHEYKLGSRYDMRGESGFAMRLAHDLSDIGFHDYRIFAHVGSGHVTKRPFCVWINEEDGFIKRREIVPYRSWASLDRKGRRQWLRWVKYIQETRDGRFRAPFLTDDELAEVIGG